MDRCPDTEKGYIASGIRLDGRLAFREKNDSKKVQVELSQKDMDENRGVLFMAEYFDICGTHIAISAIKDFRTIQVEFIFRPVFRASKKSLISAISGKKYKFDYMEPYAAIIGQQGHRSELGEYKAKSFKEALGKDIGGAVINAIADILKLKTVKRQKYQCVNLAGRAFSAYLDDIPARMLWDDGRTAEVYKEDKLYAELNEITTPGVEYITTLVVKANDTFCFYGNGIQVADATYEFERLSREQEAFLDDEKLLTAMPLQGDAQKSD